MVATKYLIGSIVTMLLLALMGRSQNHPAMLQAAEMASWFQTKTPATPHPLPVGQFHFTDNETARTGSFALQIDSINAPPLGSHYELWLRSDNGTLLLDLGALQVVNKRVTFNGHTTQPLLSTYNTLLISLEPNKVKSVTISQQIVVSATLPSAILMPVRQLFFPSQFNSKGFLSGAAQQTEIAIMHAGFLKDALKKNNVADIQRYTEHIVNILDGKDGILYGDLNRDGRIENPGDGFGVRAYLEGAQDQTTAVANALPTTAAKAAHDQAQPARAAIQDGQKLVAQASEKTIQIFAADTITKAQPLADQLSSQLAQLQKDIANASMATLQMTELRFTPGINTLLNPPMLSQTTPVSATQLITATLVPTRTQRATAGATLTQSIILSTTATPASIPTLIPTAVPTLAVTPTPGKINQAAEPTAGAVWINPVDGAMYVYVPGGEFTMGATADEAASPLEQPAHKVTVSGFWVQRTEVTNAEYARCVAAKACTPPTNQRWQQAAYAEHPVSDVNWSQASTYASWAGGRLPTEAEWEKACRGTDGRLFPWGPQAPTDKLANYNNNIGDTTKVGSYPDGASPYGALDMAGNVWEWTTSLEKSYPYDATDGREDLKAQGKRILRGGSFYYTQYQLHCTTRSGFAPTTANKHFGFRIIVSNLPTQWINPVDGAVYVYVPGGEFTMGATADEAASPLEQPAHKVTVSGFWVQRTEVTNAEYPRCVAAKACTPPTNQRWQQAAYAEHPVSDVNWSQASTYASWAGGRLPTEAEWEKACRGTDGRLFPWGPQAPTDKLANYNNNIGDTTKVGSYPDGASPYGALDMAGNVWEWTTSLEKSYPYDATDGREDLKAQGKRILRGGSFYYTQYQLHCTTRSGFAPTTANKHFGFRIIVTMPGGGQK